MWPKHEMEYAIYKSGLGPSRPGRFFSSYQFRPSKLVQFQKLYLSRKTSLIPHEWFLNMVITLYIPVAKHLAFDVELITKLRRPTGRINSAAIFAAAIFPLNHYTCTTNQNREFAYHMQVEGRADSKLDAKKGALFKGGIWHKWAAKTYFERRNNIDTPILIF